MIIKETKINSESNEVISVTLRNKDNKVIYRRYNEDDYENFYIYNPEGKLVYNTGDYGYELFKEYNDNGKCIHYKDYNNEKYYEYDEKGNLISIKDAKSDDNILIEYDENGKRICDIYPTYKIEYKYDEKGNEIYNKTYDIISDEIFREKWIEYDDNNNMTYIKIKSAGDNEDYECWEKYEYDEHGNEIKFEDSYGFKAEYKNEFILGKYRTISCTNCNDGCNNIIYKYEEI